MFLSTRRGKLGDLREDTKEYTLLSSWVLWGVLEIERETPES